MPDTRKGWNPTGRAVGLQGNGVMAFGSIARASDIVKKHIAAKPVWAVVMVRISGKPSAFAYRNHANSFILAVCILFDATRVAVLKKENCGKHLSLRGLRAAASGLTRLKNDI